ncbi:hypothetical protein HanRHA438_Chr17g0834761 [Helianthus annuus]|nr:hypothetical protein HanRHA438_Chr17g0834761 [Helianthus annuus]
MLMTRFFHTHVLRGLLPQIPHPTLTFSRFQKIPRKPEEREGGGRSEKRWERDTR